MIYRMSAVFFAALAFISCSSGEPSPGGAEQPLSDICLLPPWSLRYGYDGPQSWASDDCTDPRARGATSDGYRCALWLPDQTAHKGELWCVNRGAPVEKLFFVDPNDHVCKPWTITSESWFEWAYCGPATL